LTEEANAPGRPWPWDLLRPARLYAGIESRPSFLFPLALLVLSCLIYSETAFGSALPRVLPRLLENSMRTESELVGLFRNAIRILSVFVPIAFLFVLAVLTRLCLRITGARLAFSNVTSLLAHASLWAALGLVAKAILVLATGNPEPSVNLSLFLRFSHPAARAVLAFTNPFLWLASIWTVRGLRHFQAPPGAALFGGAAPWAIFVVFFALAGGSSTRLLPASPGSQVEWRTIPGEAVLLQVPADVGEDEQVESLARDLDHFAQQLGEHYGFAPRRVRVRVFPDHQALERASGGLLHAQVTGSIRGRELLYLELPGRSAAITPDQGEHEARRYLALMQLAPVLPEAPRWFVEGVAHGRAIPLSTALNESYLTVLRRTGVPKLEFLRDPAIYQMPQGPLLARGIVDYIAYTSGGHESVDAIVHDMIAGASFRDALYAHARLTTSALETGWQNMLAAILEKAADTRVPVQVDTTSTRTGEDAFTPFRGRQ
jgi:hypothetical protein